MINLMLPPLYQQHYFAQPQPHLYQSIQIPMKTQTENSTEILDTFESNDSMQNESPMAVVNSTYESNEKTNGKESFATSTEKMIRFRPVQKKQNNPLKSSTLK